MGYQGSVSLWIKHSCHAGFLFFQQILHIQVLRLHYFIYHPYCLAEFIFSAAISQWIIAYILACQNLIAKFAKCVASCNLCHSNHKSQMKKEVSPLTGLDS